MPSGCLPFALPLSADSPSSLAALRAECARFLRAHPDVGAADLLHTAVRRRARRCRAFALASTLDELASALEDDAPASVLTGEDEGPSPTVVEVDATASPEEQLRALGRAFCAGASVDVAPLLGRRADRTVLALPLATAVSRRVWPDAPATRPAVVDEAPLALSQERIWFTERLQPGQRAYNEPAAIRLDGPLDASALHAALRAVVRAQPALRSTVVERHDTALMRVGSDANVPLPVEDLAGADEASAVAAAIELESARRFDLTAGPLWIARLLRFGPTRHVLVLNFHHIVIDAPSCRCLARSVSLAYDALTNGRPPPEQHPRPFLDHARAERTAVARGDVDADVEHWRRLLTPLPSPVDLPMDRPRPARSDGAGGSVLRRLDRTLTARVVETAVARQATRSMCMTAGFAVLLRALSDREELLIGTVVSTQPPAYDETIGLYLNALPLKLDLRETHSFDDVVDHVRDVMLTAQEHAGAPFEEVVRRLNPPRDAGRNPLFGITIQFEPEPTWGFELSGVVATELDVPLAKSPFDLTLYVAPRGDEVQCRFEYATALFDHATVAAFADAYEALLRSVVLEPGRPLARALAAAADADPWLAEAEVGPMRPTHEASVVGWIHEQVRRDPAAPAVEAADGRPIAYADVWEQAAALALRLAERRVGPGSVVMLALAQDPRLAVAMLGVLMCGAAYAPLDLRIPQERAARIVEEARPTVLVHDGAPPAWWPADRPHIAVADATPSSDRAVAEAAARPPDPAAPAYVLHTSGSTGRPKGVTMPHAALANLVAWHRDEHRSARTLQYASPAFDVATQEIVCTLATGGTIVTIAPELRYDAAALVHELATRRVERAHLPAAIVQRLASVLADDAALAPSLREILVSGEQLVLTDALRGLLADRPELRLTNEYGPTETHVVTRQRVRGDAGAHVPIGSPVPNVVVRLLDRDGRRVVRGAVGELCVGGPQVTTGYGAGSGDEARFATDPSGSGSRLYRTGDLARWRPDGALTFLGRGDDQVKVRGNRVELGEIAEVLRGSPLVADVAVVASNDANGDAALAAHVVPVDVGLDDATLLADLRALLARTVPDYMIPASWSLLTRLPLNANGKLDRAALPAPRAGDASAGDDLQAVVGAESTVREIWCAELGLDAVAATTSFFDVGGHSLSAVGVVGRINERLGVTLSILDFFREPTIRGTAAQVERLAAAAGAAP